MDLFLNFLSGLFAAGMFVRRPYNLLTLPGSGFLYMNLESSASGATAAMNKGSFTSP